MLVTFFFKKKSTIPNTYLKSLRDLFPKESKVFLQKRKKKEH